MQRREDTQQLLIDWSNPPPAESSVSVAESSLAPLPPPPAEPAPAAPVLCLAWDFVNTFPQPTEEALQAGLLSDEDCDIDCLRALHEEHAAEALVTLHDLDAILDARRRNVDPHTDKPPRTQAAKDRLAKLFNEEPQRLERNFEGIMGAYADAFGNQAAEAFTQAIRTRHAGIAVVQERPPAEIKPTRSRLSTKLPVPRPLHTSVAAGVFGYEENGRPVNPSPDEVREITDAQATKLVDLLGQGSNGILQLRSVLRAYADDFGPRAAERLESHARHRAIEEGVLQG
jgi:hypothetical protein